MDSKDFELELNEIKESGGTGNLVEISKMRKLEDARRKWESRHCSNSPFRAECYGSSNSMFGSDAESSGSGMSLGKGYG